MSRLLAIASLVSLMTANCASAYDMPQQQSPMTPSSTSEDGTTGPHELPPLPHGKATVMGGEIQNADAVRDKFTLKVPGGRSIKLLFDARTRLYRDGVRLAPGDLHSGDRASVETVLDGTDVFALSIHILSRPPEGECEGQVISYAPGARVLIISNALSHEPIKLQVPLNTQMIRAEQAASPSTLAVPADLIAGTLISVKFESDHRGGGVARQISIQAIPGASFVFSGNISSLDLHSGLIVLIDPVKDKIYPLSFDPRQFPSSRNLHLGDHVRVTASFNSTRYVASSIAVD